MFSYENNYHRIQKWIKYIEIVVSRTPDSISEFQNHSILMIFLEASDCTDESR